MSLPCFLRLKTSTYYRTLLRRTSRYWINVIWNIDWSLPNIIEMLPFLLKSALPPFKLSSINEHFYFTSFHVDRVVLIVSYDQTLYMYWLYDANMCEYLYQRHDLRWTPSLVLDKAQVTPGLRMVPNQPGIWPVSIRAEPWSIRIKTVVITWMVRWSLGGFELFKTFVVIRDDTWEVSDAVINPQ